MKGMFNKILTINLSDQVSKQIPIAEELYLKYLGGRGLATKLLIDQIPTKVDPLSPQNSLVITIGPLTGTTVPTAGRTELVTKSPLTGGIFYSNTGGFIGPTLKSNGIDGLIINNALKEPGYIVLDSKGAVQFKDAKALWGLDTRETMNKLKEIEGKNIHCLIIGPAGENLVRIACIMNDGDHRAFGRGGVGAVMGSKKLKAIIIKPGTIKAEIHDPELLKKFTKTAFDKIKVVPITRSSYPTFGTAGLVNIINEYGFLPINNFQFGYSEQADKISGETIRDTILKESEACYNCPIRCGRFTKAGDMEGKGPEYESDWALGADCGVFDLIKVAQANYYCNLLGIDTITMGSTIACAMELQQRGVIKEKEICFGNADILIPLIKKTAIKEGIGADLAEGSKRMAQKYGMPELSMSVKGMEMPAYDPRGAMGHALGYATANRGGDHLTGYLLAMELLSAPKKIDRFTLGGKADLLALKQHQATVEDCLVVCRFAGFAIGFDFLARFTTAVTGIDMNISHLLEIGERIYNLERMFNLREGLTKADDTLPPRFLNEPFKEGYSKDKVVPIESLLKDYYAVRKWDKNGIPTIEKLKSLGIEGEIKL